ncbi:MAG: hypothetical protein ACR2FF_03160 [Mycobacteriales bacterium]
MPLEQVSERSHIRAVTRPLPAHRIHRPHTYSCPLPTNRFLARSAALDGPVRWSSQIEPNQVIMGHVRMTRGHDRLHSHSPALDDEDEDSATGDSQANQPDIACHTLRGSGDSRQELNHADPAVLSP